MQYLTEGDILAFYREVIGAPVVRFPEGLAAAVLAPQQIMRGPDDYVALMRGTAALISAMTKHRPFVHGNRRAAWICGKLFLQLHGYTVCASDAEVLELLTRSMTNAVTPEALADWIDHHVSCFTPVEYSRP